MPYRLTTIYTRTGDEGYTTLGRNRLSKDDLLIEVLGTLDELNAHIGLICAHSIKTETVMRCLQQVQNDLFDLGGELHAPQYCKITPEKTAHLEQTLDAWNATLPPLKEFILPGGNLKSASAHVARTVCRRTERCLVRLHRQVPLHNLEMLRYINRLSDLLFVASRILALESQAEEILWEHERGK